MTSVNNDTYYNGLGDLTGANQKSVRKVSSSASGDKVVSEGDTSLFSSTESMGKNDFLNLLVTQLKYQDPLEPTADTEFVAQLAQFSQLENSQNMSSGMEKLSESMSDFMSLQTLNSQSMTNASATPLIGKKVRVSESTLDHTAKATQTFQVNLYEGNKQGTLVIRDEKDTIVAEIALQNENSKGGDLTVTWDGTAANGDILPAGRYSMEVQAQDGTSSAGYVYMEGTVSAVSFGANCANLTIGDKKYGLKNLVNVENAES
jgi:flagellar basal-body rod modification protein FlgD